MRSASTLSRPSLPQRLYRRVYWLRRDLPVLRRLGWKPTVLYAGIGGIGDELICTTSLFELHRRGIGNLIVLARHEELFQGHPARPHILPCDQSFIQTAQNWGLALNHPCEWQKNDASDEDRQLPPSDHVIAENCRAAGLAGEVTLRPYLVLDQSERDAGHFSQRQVVIQTSVAGAQYPYLNKEWLPERFQTVVDELRDQFDFIQLGSTHDPLLSNVRDLRGRTTLRLAGSILASARFFIGPEGFLMHLARAVDTRSIIIFGGHTRPDQIGYPCNENLYTAVPCAPCWRKNRCEFDRVCMSEISAGHVVAAVQRMTARENSPLETTALEL
jgi:hypothetical protein